MPLDINKPIRVDCPWPDCDAWIEAFPAESYNGPRGASPIRAHPHPATKRGGIVILECPHGRLSVDHEGGWIRLHDERGLGRRDPAVIAAEIAEGRR